MTTPALKASPRATRIGRRVWWRLAGDGQPRQATVVVAPRGQIYLRVDDLGVVAATRSELFVAAEVAA